MNSAVALLPVSRVFHGSFLKQNEVSMFHSKVKEKKHHEKT